MKFFSLFTLSVLLIVPDVKKLHAQQPKIKTITTYDNLWGPGSKESVMEFNENGQQTCVSMFRADSLLWRETISYDSLGRKTAVNHYGPDGEFQTYRIMTYDSTGRLCIARSFKSDSTAIGIDSCWLDARGNEIEVAEYFADGSFYLRIVYEYDRKGNMVKKTYYGNEVKVPVVNLYEYNRKGDVQWSQTGLLKYEHKYTYEYDRNGNWIWQLNEYGGRIAEREIAYY